jgi:hypothetical protein
MCIKGTIFGAGTSICLVILLMSHSLHAKSIWLTWELDLGSHAPPEQFVLTVSSPSGAMVPPPMIVPFGVCQASSLARPGLYCAQVGCPPKGTYEFVAQAQFGDVLSPKSNIARCTLPVNSAVCDCTPGAKEPPAPPVKTPAVAAPAPPADLPLDPTPPPLSSEPPPLPQQSAEGLNLLPVGELPPTPTPPPIPDAWPSQKGKRR